MPNDLLTTTEAAARLNTSRRNVRNYIKKGQLPAVRFGKRGILIPVAAVDGFTPPPAHRPKKVTNGNDPLSR